MPLFPAGSLLAAYLRDSGGDEQDLSIDQQEKAIKEWCTENGYTLNIIFKDEARPGSSTVGRQAFVEMINHFHKPGCSENGVIIWKYSRFARDIDDAQFFKADLRRRGFIIYSIKDTIPGGIDGRFFEAAIDWMNARFLEDLSLDTKRGLRFIVSELGAMPGHPPAGFKREPFVAGTRRDGTQHILHRWVPDQEQIPLIQRAFQMRAQGASYWTIHNNFKIFKGINSYTTFFNNPLYIGILKFGDITIEGYCEPIISQEEWDAVQKTSIERVNNFRSNNPDHPRRNSSSFTLSGIIRCAHCGSVLSGTTAKIAKYDEPYRYYICIRQHRRAGCTAEKIPASILENKVLEIVLNEYLNRESIESMKDYYINNQGDLQKETANQEAIFSQRLASTRKQISNITSIIAEQGLEVRSLLIKLSELENEESNIKSQLAKIQDRKGLSKNLSNVDDDQLSHLREVLKKAEPTLIRKIYRGIIESITVERHNKTINGEITFFYPPNSGDGTSFFMPTLRLPGGVAFFRHKFFTPIKTIRHPKHPPI